MLPEWRNGKRGRVILQDEDMTTKVEGEYKRYNTLAHYKVSDGALMALIPKQASQQSLSISSGSHHKFGECVTPGGGTSVLSFVYVLLCFLFAFCCFSSGCLPFLVSH